MKENEIYEILGSFENELGEKKQLQSVKYYNEFTFNGELIQGLENIFVTIEKSEDGRDIYTLYTPNMKKVLSMDSNGKMLECLQELELVLGKIDIEELIEENEERKKLKGISKKASPEKIQKRLKNKKDEPNKQKEEEEKENPEEQLQKDIGIEEDLEISYYREITDDDFGRQMGMDLNQYQEIGLAYSKSKNAFILVGKKDGQFQQVEGFEPAQPTYKKVLNIDEKGENVENEVPHAIMKTNDPEKEVSITIKEQGYIEVGTVDRLPCNARVQRQVGEQGETREGETVEQLNRTIEQEGEEAVHKWVHSQKEANKQIKQGESREGDITEEISNANNNIIDEDALIKNAAQNRAKMSEKGFREILETVPAEGTIKERIDKAVDIAHEQSRTS